MPSDTRKGREEPRQERPNRPRANVQNVHRRSSKNSSSRDRHGRIFNDQDRSIRAVTPESPSSFVDRDYDPVLLQSPTSHPSHIVSYPNEDHTASVSNTDEEGTIESRRRKNKAKPSSKDEPVSDASPNSFMSKTRKRLGSITTNAAFVPGARLDEPFSSIGFPSVISASASQDYHEGRRTPRRTFSSEVANGSSSSGLRSPPVLDTDSSKILQLMKTTCGRMHGILFFRPMHTTLWASGYCAINVAPGSLVCQVKGDVTTTKTLIPDLRGCSVRTHYDSETQTTYLSVVTAASGCGYQLRPPVPETFDSWLAALLCWQPLRPKGIHNKMPKPQPVTTSDRRPAAQKRFSDINIPKSTAIVKIGKLLLWEGPVPSASQRHVTLKPSGHDSEAPQLHMWRRVNCTLHENGKLKLLSDVDARVLTTIPMSQLARCAVQRLDESVLDAKWCIAIYPQYTVPSTSSRQTRPIYLCFETAVVFEAWFVLLRALTIPELYGPEQSNSTGSETSSVAEEHSDLTGQAVSGGMFRVERALAVKITEAKFNRRLTTGDGYPRKSRFKGKVENMPAAHADVYVEIMLDKDLCARTMTKRCSTSAFWAEEFQLNDLPAVLSRVCVAVKINNPAEREWTMVAHGSYDVSDDLSVLGGVEVSSHDPIYGGFELQLDDLEQQGVVEKWWPLLDINERQVGQALVRLSMTETVVLMDEEYKELSALLHNFSNSLTTQIAQVLGPELKQLSDILLDIFQSSGSATEWINNLIEEEIDGVFKDAPQSRIRYSGRVHSNDSYESAKQYESAEQRQLVLREFSRSATMEANLLFRGNSLVTKALDAHMRRLGSQYLEETLGSRLRTIVERDPDCEVDPVRVRAPEQLERNWSNLINLTSAIWRSISASAANCPPGLRLLFKHIRSCAEDRYGEFIRTVKYTSVSGFLFLRFFCPAILNPKLFGLLPGMYSTRPKLHDANNLRTSGRANKANIHVSSEIAQCPCEHVQIRYQGALDGTYEQVFDNLDARL